MPTRCGMRAKPTGSHVVIVRSYARMRGGQIELVRKHVRSQHGAQLHLPLGATLPRAHETMPPSASNDHPDDIRAIRTSSGSLPAIDLAMEGEPERAPDTSSSLPAEK